MELVFRKTVLAKENSAIRTKNKIVRLIILKEIFKFLMFLCSAQTLYFIYAYWLVTTHISGGRTTLEILPCFSLPSLKKVFSLLD